MNKTVITGIVLAGVGYLVLGFFWFGPSFLAGRLGILDVIGPYLGLALFLAGFGIMIAALARRTKKS